MAFCPNCGTNVEGKFCPKCGSAVSAAGAPGGSYTPPPPPAPQSSYTAPSPSTYQPPGAGYPPPGPDPGYNPPPPGYNQTYTPPPGGAVASSGMAENVASLLCYVLGWLTGVLFLVLEPYNKNRNIRFHAFQSIFFSIGWTIVWFVVMIVSGILAHIPILGWIVDLLLWLALSIGGLVIWVMLMVKAYNNTRLVLPIIGPLAEKQA